MGGLNKLEEKEKSMEYNFDSDAKENDIYKNCKKDTYTIYSTISKIGISIKGYDNAVSLTSTLNLHDPVHFLNVL